VEGPPTIGDIQKDGTSGNKDPPKVQDGNREKHAEDQDKSENIEKSEGLNTGDNTADPEVGSGNATQPRKDNEMEVEAPKSTDDPMDVEKPKPATDPQPNPDVIENKPTEPPNPNVDENSPEPQNPAESGNNNGNQGLPPIEGNPAHPGPVSIENQPSQTAPETHGNSFGSSPPAPSEQQPEPTNTIAQVNEPEHKKRDSLTEVSSEDEVQKVFMKVAELLGKEPEVYLAEHKNSPRTLLRQILNDSDKSYQRNIQKEIEESKKDPKRKRDIKESLKYVKEVRKLRGNIEDEFNKLMESSTWDLLAIQVDEINGKTVLMDFDSESLNSHAAFISNNSYDHYSRLYVEQIIPGVDIGLFK
jgi:hypothetical protein